MQTQFARLPVLTAPLTIQMVARSIAAAASQGFDFALDRQRRAVRSRSEFPITATELNAMAAPAMTGLNSIPNHG